jgi:hypothetical protein
VAKLKDHHRVIWQIAGGTGKTRVIAVAAMSALLWLNCSEIHIVVSNGALMRKDSAELADYWALASFQERVVYHS